MIGDPLARGTGARLSGDAPRLVQGTRAGPRAGRQRGQGAHGRLAGSSPAQRPNEPGRKPRLDALAQRREHTVAHRRAPDREAQRRDQALEQAAGARLIEVDEVNAAVRRDHDVLGPQVVVAHAAPRQGPDQTEQAQLHQGEVRPGELEPAERPSGHPLEDEDLPAVCLDQLERRRDAGQARAAPQQIELAAQILPAPRPDPPRFDDLVEPIVREAEGTRRIQRAGPARRLHQRRLGAAGRAHRHRDFLVRHESNGYQDEPLTSTMGF